MRFSSDIVLDESELVADSLLTKLKQEVGSGVLQQDFFKEVASLKDSQLYQFLDRMPKGGLHHLHTGSTPSAEFYVSLTYQDSCYYDPEKKIFKVSTKPVSDPRFKKCNELRKEYSSPEDFDEMLV